MTLFTVGFLLGVACSYLMSFVADLGRKHAQADMKTSADKAQSYREPAKVSFMVTRDQQQALADLGYSKEQRGTITPVEAHKVIEQQTGPKVIRKGATKFRRDCINCNARFEYSISDVRGGSTHCPECGSDNMHMAYYAV